MYALGVVDGDDALCFVEFDQEVENGEQAYADAAYDAKHGWIDR